MAAPALQRFYENLRRLRRRLLVFILPSAVALLIILGGELYPEWMGAYMMYLAQSTLSERIIPPTCILGKIASK